MSYDDKRFMAAGIRVRHKYKYRRGCHAVCERCGVKRRRASSGYEYSGGFSNSGYPWSLSNPPCVARKP